MLALKVFLKAMSAPGGPLPLPPPSPRAEWGYVSHCLGGPQAAGWALLHPYVPLPSVYICIQRMYMCTNVGGGGREGGGGTVILKLRSWGVATLLCASLEMPVGFGASS